MSVIHYSSNATTAARQSWLRWLSTRALPVVAIVAALPYVYAPIYRFPPPCVFTGSSFLNPYAELRGHWLRANLHAHGRAWSGLTNGRQPDEQVVRHYAQLGYDVAGVSDYQRIAAHNGIATIPIYEHGYNIVKRHQLAIGARKVEWFDFPLWQSTSHEQYIIDRIRRHADLIALAHPNSRGAYSADDLQRLTGYDLIEVGNGRFSAENAWDAALSSGHAVWAVANDDTHDLTDPDRTGVGWNMIDAPSPRLADVVQALKTGRTYAVVRTGPIDATALAQSSIPTVSTVDMRDGRLTVSSSGSPSTFAFIGQDGAVRKTVEATTSASYTFSVADTYIRTQITSPDAVIFLNPIIRFDGAAVPRPAASIDALSTWSVRGSSALVCLALVGHRLRRTHFSRRPPREVVEDVRRKTA